MYIDESTRKVNQKNLYFVAYNPNIKKYVLACEVTWICWYERYFEITEDEYNMFGSEELDAIADECHKMGASSKRFLFSIKNEENNEEQLALRDEAKIAKR